MPGCAEIIPYPYEPRYSRARYDGAWRDARAYRGRITSYGILYTRAYRCRIAGSFLE